jgi:hypothetical protein
MIFLVDWKDAGFTFVRWARETCHRTCRTERLLRSLFVLLVDQTCRGRDRISRRILELQTGPDPALGVKDMALVQNGLMIFERDQRTVQHAIIIAMLFAMSLPDRHVGP